MFYDNQNLKKTSQLRAPSILLNIYDYDQMDPSLMSPGMKIRETLPENYYQRVVEMENEFHYKKNFHSINQLVYLYKVGVEYYSAKDAEKQADYIMRLQSLLSNKLVLKLARRNSNKDSVSRRTSSFKRRGNSRETTKKKRRSLLFKINYRNALTKDDSMNMEQVVKNHEHNLNRGAILMKQGLGLQRANFAKRLKQKRNQKWAESDSKAIRRTLSYIKRRTLDSQDNLMIDKGRTAKKIGFKSEKKNSLPIFDRAKQGLDIYSGNTTKKKSKKNQISKIVDDYLSSFRKNYIESCCAESMRKLSEILEKTFQHKSEKLFEFNDQRKEFELMLIDNPNDMVSNSIDKLLNSLRLDHEKELMRVDKEVNSEVRSLIEERSKKDIRNNEKMATLEEEIIQRIINIFK